MAEETPTAFVPPHPSIARLHNKSDRLAADPRRRQRVADPSVPRCSQTLSKLPPADLPPPLPTTLPCPNSASYLSLLSVPLLLPRLSALEASGFEALPTTLTAPPPPPKPFSLTALPALLPAAPVLPLPDVLPSPPVLRSLPVLAPTPGAPAASPAPRRVSVAPPDRRARTFAFNRSLNRLCRRRRSLHPCLAVLAEMRERGIPADKYTYSAVLTAVARARARDVATELYHQIRSDGVELDDYLRASLLKVAGSGERPQLDLCVRLFRGARRPSRVMCNVMMDAYANAGRLDDCVATFRYMLGAAIVADGYSISALAKGYVVAGRLDDAVDTLAQARASGLDVPAAACGQIMDAYGKRGDVDGAMRVFDTMTLWGVAPTRVSFNILIGACGAARDMSRAFEVYDEMRHTTGLSPDRFTFHALMKACLAAGAPARALQLYRELRRSKFLPNQVSYRLALVAAGMGLEADAVDEIVRDMRRNSCQARMDVAASGVAACIRCADLAGARALFVRYVDAKRGRGAPSEASTRALFGAMRAALQKMEPHVDETDPRPRDHAQTAHVVDELERRWVAQSHA